MQQPIPPVGGSPLIPPSYLTAYFAIFFICLSVAYIYFYRKHRPVLLWQKVKLLIVLAFTLKVTAILGGALLGVYWLVPPPAVRRVVPKKTIEIVFDRPLDRHLLEKSISPDTPGLWVFENSLYTTHLYRKLVFYPTYSLRPDTTYTINLNGIRNLIEASKPYDYQYEFKTPPSPKVGAVSYSKGKIEVTLDSPNDSVSEFDFQFTPKFEFEANLNSDKTGYTITPKTELGEETQYNLKIQKTDIILNLDEGTIVERSPATQVYDGDFVTEKTSVGLISKLRTLTPRASAQVSNVTPENGWSAVSVQTPIKITFDTNLDHASAEQKFTISPKVEGSFSWDGNTLTFTPISPLSFSTTYTISLGEFKSEFSTQNATTKLAVPVYLQKYTLSCEIASLRMALNYRGANVSEDDIIPKVGFDTTPHSGNVWGNPYKAFVGNIRGTQMKDGYGVYWGPIAKAARQYRDAQEFENWDIKQLTGAIVSGNPVVVWVYSHFGTPTSWVTPDGTQIYAVRDEHAVTVVGFVGPADSPTQIIVNDPLSGQVYWSIATFNKKWNIFNRSGVVVF